MKTSKIKYLVLLGLLATWASRSKQRRRLKAEGAEPSLASLVEGLPPDPARSDEAPSAVNPFPKSNPTPLPTGAAPGG